MSIAEIIALAVLFCGAFGAPIGVVIYDDKAEYRRGDRRRRLGL